MRKSLICAALLCAAGSANADLVASNNRSELRLMAAPCDHPALVEAIAQVDAQIKPEERLTFRKGQASIPGETLALCWADTGEGTYVILLENGQALMAPVTAFVSRPGA